MEASSPWCSTAPKSSVRSFVPSCLLSSPFVLVVFYLLFFVLYFCCYLLLFFFFWHTIKSSDGGSAMNALAQGCLPATRGFLSILSTLLCKASTLARSVCLSACLSFFLSLCVLLCLLSLSSLLVLSHVNTCTNVPLHCIALHCIDITLHHIITHDTIIFTQTTIQKQTQTPDFSDMTLYAMLSCMRGQEQAVIHSYSYDSATDTTKVSISPANTNEQVFVRPLSLHFCLSFTDSDFNVTSVGWM